MKDESRSFPASEAKVASHRCQRRYLVNGKHTAHMWLKESCPHAFSVLLVLSFFKLYFTKMSSFIIVDLIDHTEEWVVIVKCNWVIDEVQKVCWYPHYRNSERVKKLLKDGVAPENDWFKYSEYDVRHAFGMSQLFIV